MATPGSKTLEPIATKLGVHNYVGDTFLNFQIWERSGCVGVSVSAHLRMREISLFVTPFKNFLFVSSPRLQVATVDRFSRSIHQTTHFRARKCLLGVSMMNFHIYPLSPPKHENLHYTAYGNFKSGIFKDRSKMFAPKRGFWGWAI